MKINFRTFRMVSRALLFVLYLGVTANCAMGVEVIVSGSTGFNSADPTGSQITDWNTGWGSSGISGWNYVGNVDGASGVYLGNNWVITAAHVGAGSFSLDGTSYNMVAGSAVGISDTNGTADVTLFRVSQGPALPSLNIPISEPNSFTGSQDGDFVAMIGFGGGAGETWGLNEVTAADYLTNVESYETKDFLTYYESYNFGQASINNEAVLTGGDSGGGDFIFDAASGQWTLAGVNEAVNSDTSYMVELSDYEPQIEEITGVPEPNRLLLAGLGLMVLVGLNRRAQRQGIEKPI
jgi:Trypsin